jgi:hypothetical protein
MRLSWLFPVLLVAAVGCDQPTASQRPAPTSSPKAEGAVVIKPGGIYSYKSDGDFRVAKVLVVEDDAVHARLHTNRYTERPTTIDPKELKVAIGHVPILEAGFRNWDPVLLLEQPVTDEELVEYLLWRDQ